ncbi:MAG: hypothetical protein K2W33_15580, partial [Burkholderiales bacterium]|nr:hypothetical protein [Burkholderiales bacterium]
MSPLKETVANLDTRLQVVVALPAYTALSGPLTYLHTQPCPAGSLVRVPLGQRDVLGIAWDDDSQASQASDATESAGPLTLSARALKPVSLVLPDCPPLNPAWRALIGFAARYYQRSLGEMALAALPPQLRDLSPEQWQRRIKRLHKA